VSYLNIYLYFSIVLLAVGVYGLLSRKSWAKVLISLEIIVFSALVLLALVLLYSNYLGIYVGQTFLILLIFLDSSMTGILLACILLVYRRFRARSIDDMSRLRG